VRLGMAIEELHRAETELAEEFAKVAERHAAEHDVHHLCTTLARQCHIDWEMVGQGAKAVRDKELLATVTDCLEQTGVQVKWLTTRIKEASPQTLTVG
jgi:hypothetical protein